jgi:hypothetical protein
MTPHGTLDARWYPSASSQGEDERVVAEPIPGDILRSSLAGGVAGAVAGIVAIAAAAAAMDPARLVERVRIVFGLAPPDPHLSLEDLWLRLAFAALLGGLAGAGLGGLMRRLHGRVARAVFGAVLVPSIWIAFDAFVLVRFAPALAAALPFVPSLVGAIVFGVCATVVRPVVPRVKRSVAHPDGTASFLLVRRRS